MFRLLHAAVLLAALCGAVITGSQADEKKQPPPKKKDTPNANKVAAIDLMREYEDDAKKFKEKYKEKPLVIEGEVYSVEPEAKLVRLRANTGDGVVKTLVCEFPQLPKEQYGQFKKGETAVIRGTLSFFVGGSDHILIDFCEPAKK